MMGRHLLGNMEEGRVLCEAVCEKTQKQERPWHVAETEWLEYRRARNGHRVDIVTK